MSEYLEFIELPNDGKKTRKYQVVSKKWQYPLGEIKFFNHWRQYAFFPAPDTIFNNTCMNDLVNFIKSIPKKENT
jgi:hypothetical protein